MRKLIGECYGGFRLCEEEPIPQQDGVESTLFVDFVIHELKLAIEVQGRQHFEYVPHFHKNMQGFEASQRRDAAKAQAVKDCGYTLMCFNGDEVPRLARRHFLSAVGRATQPIKGKKK